MLRGEVWLVNLDPTLGGEIKKPVLQSSSMMMPLGFYR